MSHARVQSNHENTGKSLTTDSKAYYDTETNTSDVKKIKNRSNKNFEDEANNMQQAELDKENGYSRLGMHASLARMRCIGICRASCYGSARDYLLSGIQLSNQSVNAYATMSIGIMGSKSLVLLDRGSRRFSNKE